MSNNRYPEEFRAEAVNQIIDRRYSVQEVSQRLGVSTHSLYKWMKASGRWGDKAQGEEIDAVRQENLRPSSGVFNVCQRCYRVVVCGDGRELEYGGFRGFENCVIYQDRPMAPDYYRCFTSIENAGKQQFYNIAKPGKTL